MLRSYSSAVTASAQKHGEREIVAAVADGGLIDPVTATYVRHHNLAFVLQAMDKVLRDVEDDLAAVATPSPPNPVNPKSSSSPTTSQENPTAASSSVREEEEESLSTTHSSKAKVLEASLMLQLLLSSFTPLSSTPSTAAASAHASKGGGVRQHSSPPSPVPLLLSNTVKDTKENGGTAVAAIDLSSSSFSASATTSPPWPADASFATKDSAFKAEVCRCFVQQCEQLHTGLGLVDACGPGLRWSHLCLASGGHERLGVAFVFDVLRCWRHVAVPLLLATGDLVVPGEQEPVREAAELLFDALVTPSASPMQPQNTTSMTATAVRSSAKKASGEAVCSYWCLTLLQGYCRDFPAGLWVSIVRAAQHAAIAQKRRVPTHATCTSAEGNEPQPPLLTSETVLLRSFLAHLACPANDAASSPPVNPSAGKVETSVYVSTAVAAARLRSPAGIWAEVTEMQTLWSEGGAYPLTDTATMSALLCADGYWTLFFQPYTSMCAHYCL
jgi:hypothetical protein